MVRCARRGLIDLGNIGSKDWGTLNIHTFSCHHMLRIASKVV